jgi:hypothetical protein
MPYRWSYQRVKRDDVKPEASTAKIDFDRLQGTARFDDQLMQDRRHRFRLQAHGDRIIRGHALDIAGVSCAPEVGHKSTAAEGAVDLEGRAKDRVAERNARAPHRLRRLFDPLAQLVQQLLKLGLLRRLGCVVSLPILRIGLTDRLRDGHRLRDFL